MRFARLRSGLLVSAVLLATPSSAADMSSEPSANGGRIELSEEAGSLRGRFSHSEVEVGFRADRTPEGRVTVEVGVGDLLFELAYDSEAEDLHLTGDGGTVSLEGRRALQELSVVLEKRWEPYTASISPEKHLAFRTILLLSEAPVGHPMEERAIEAGPLPPNVRTETEPHRR